MRKFGSLALAALILLSFAAILPLSASAVEPSAHLMVVEWYGRGSVEPYAIPPTDNSMSNRDFKLLRFYWHTRIEYWINSTNGYGFDESAVVGNITASANTWDEQTSYTLFVYKGTTEKTAGVYDGYNVVAWGSYDNPNVIAVTYIWYTRNQIVETDTEMNTVFSWSLSGEAGMDVQNIMTHEFGHWCGLDDLYRDRDYWLTMYGYSDYGETYKRTLGLGDILGLQKRYGA